MKLGSIIALIGVVAWASGGCQGRTPAPGPSPAGTAAQSEGGSDMKLHGPFENSQVIPRKHSGEGDDASPRLSWSTAPAGVQSFALICDDPDAPSPKRPAAEPWVHWVIYNIPADVTELPEKLPRLAEPSEVAGARQGKNSWDRDNVGYRGPLPPPGSGSHRYFFKLYALDVKLNIQPAGATKAAVLAAMRGHILAEAQLVGTYERK